MMEKKWKGMQAGRVVGKKMGSAALIQAAVQTTCKPLKNVVMMQLLMGKSIRVLAMELVRKCKDLIAWLYGPVVEAHSYGQRTGYQHQHHQRVRPLLSTIKKWHILVGMGVAGMIVRKLYGIYREQRSGRWEMKKQLKQKMAGAKTYEEWREAALQLKHMTTPDQGRKQYETMMYDEKLIEERYAHLKRVRQRGDPYEVMFEVRADLLRNMGNMADASLHRDMLEVPMVIQEYLEEVKACLRCVTRSNLVQIEDRLAFLRETRHSFGRTALVLSGGGSFGSFHLGVIKALLDASLLPRVLSGSSAGAIVAALVGTRTREELKELFESLEDRLKDIDFYSSNTLVQITSHLIAKGTLQDYRVLQDRLRKLLAVGGEDLTFEQAFARSGIALNVAVSAADTSEPPRLLNYLTAPNVLIWSAVACSSAFPLLFAPQLLLARDAKGRVMPFANRSAGESRRWRDGSLEEDLPMRGLSEMFNVNYFLVSQCNPYLLPIIAAKESVPRTLGVLAEQEFKHRCQQLMELMPRRFGASKILKLLSQPWEGDVTMVLPVTTFSTLKAVINLSKDDVILAMCEGQKATWAKIASIATTCDVEVTLDECLRLATSKARKKALLKQPCHKSPSNGRLRKSIPSWLHLQSLGIPHADSYERLASNRHADSVGRSPSFPSGFPSNALISSSVPEDLALMDDNGSFYDLEAMEEDEESTPGKPQAQLPINTQEVWKQLFEVAPASNALDIIAP